jgi:DnaJ-class molecular chaperone
MLCPRCHGTHVVWDDGRPVPCPECGGAGELHCCDGLQEQPEGGEPANGRRQPAGGEGEPPAG